MTAWTIFWIVVGILMLMVLFDDEEETEE